MSDVSTTIRAIASEETPTGDKWAEERLISQPPTGDLTQEQEDLREWGFLYGLANGIARGEDAYEANEKVAERAYDATLGGAFRRGGSALHA